MFDNECCFSTITYYFQQLNRRLSFRLFDHQMCFSKVDNHFQQSTWSCNVWHCLQQSEDIKTSKCAFQPSTHPPTIELPFWRLDLWGCAFHIGFCSQVIGVSTFLRDYACKLARVSRFAMTSACTRALHQFTKVLLFSMVCARKAMEVQCFSQIFYCNVTDMLHNVFISRIVSEL